MLAISGPVEEEPPLANRVLTGSVAPFCYRDSMNAPRIEIKYVDGGNEDPSDCGYIHVVVNGFSQPAIFFSDFDTGNDARIHIGLQKLVASVYEKGFRNGESESKKKVNELIDWAKSR